MNEHYYWKWKLKKFDSNKQHLSRGDKWIRNDMVHVDISSHHAVELNKIQKIEYFADYDYIHTINITIQDYWNDLKDVWCAKFVSKCGTSNDNNTIKTRYDNNNPVCWDWNNK